MTLIISATSVSFGMKGDDVARIHQALQALGRDVHIGESASAVMGTGTVAVVKALQQDLGAPVSGVVDAATVRAINANLALLATDRRVVRRSVSTPMATPSRTAFCRFSRPRLWAGHWEVAPMKRRNKP